MSLHLHMNIEKPPKKKESFIHDFEVRVRNRGSGVLTRSKTWGVALEMQVQEGTASPATEI
jgi:hypothetical protein